MAIPKKHRSRIYIRGKKGTYWYYAVWNGREYRESLRTNVKAIAKQKQRNKDKEYGEPDYIFSEKRDPTVDSFWKVDPKHMDTAAYDTGLYAEWLRKHRADKTFRTQRRFWRALLSHTKAKRLGDIKRSDIESFKLAAVAGTITGQAKPWSESSTNNALKDFQAMYNRAISEEWYSGTNPVLIVKRFTIATTPPEPHDYDDLLNLLSAAGEVGPHTEWTVLLGAWAGMRKGEILGAKWEWFRFDSTEPTIIVKHYPGFDIKDRQEREIGMSSRIRRAMQPHAKPIGFVFDSGRPSQHVHRYPYTASVD